MQTGYKRAIGGGLRIACLPERIVWISKSIWKINASAGSQTYKRKAFSKLALSKIIVVGVYSHGENLQGEFWHDQPNQPRPDGD
jgi:hypothetical protein